MNTSYNKDRIIEDGWKIVLLNSMKSIRYKNHQIDKYISGSRTNDSVHSVNQNLGQNKTNSQDTAQNEKRNIPKKSEPNKKYLKPKNDLRRSPKPDIFIIYNPETQHSPISHSSKYEPGDLEQILGRNKNTSTNHHSRALAMSSPSPTVSEYDEQNRPLSYRLKIGKQLLTEMQQCLGDEKEYIHYFRQFVEFEELVNDEVRSSINDFKIEPFVSFPSSKQQKTKNNKTRQTKKETKNNQTKTKMSKKALDSLSSTNRLLRKQLRMHLLNNFTSNLQDENEYNSFVDSLINLEEGFVEDD